ncbi:uncharacterized protein LOC127074220 [Lathyrus oleraceus]|uniref:Uncharacterized protein n=1 Tax=Pisum sativum TaxID=3888 RepID=A0A9D5AQD7_PEA|nr:uncharacterized protein LOC127074220 [Pisum sativum]KAI5417608.1 hypothetical protein KIW84_042278 [Pisum sativum]
MKNGKRRSSSKIDVPAAKKTAYNLRARGQRVSYAELSDYEIELQMSFDDERENDNKQVDSTSLQSSKANSAAESSKANSAAESSKANSTAESSTAGAEKTIKTEMVEFNTNLDAGLGKSNMPSGNSTSCPPAAINNNSGEDNVAEGSAVQCDVQIDHEPPRESLIPDLNLMPKEEDEY